MPPGIDKMQMLLKRILSGLTPAAVCLCAIPGAWAACSGPPSLEARIHAHPDAQAYAELGTWFGQRNQYSCAVDALHAGLRLDPRSAPLNYYLGLSLFSSGRMEEAIAPLKRTGELDPKALEPHLILATIFGRLQRRDEANAEWKAALRIDSTSTVALDGFAKSLNAAGDYAETISLLHSAPLNEDLTLDLAFAYGKSEMLEKSNELLTAALQTSPSSVRLTHALATVYIQQKRSDDAQALLERYLPLHPNDLDGQRMYLPLLVLSGEFAKARPIAVKLLALDPHNFDLLFLNGLIEHQAAEYTAAREHLTEAIALNPNDSSSHFYLGLTLVGLEDAPGAREQFAKAVALDPSNREAHFQFAAVLRTLGEKDLAQEQSRISQQIFQNQAQHSMADAKAEDAAKKLAAGDTQQAVALYREALEVAPQDAGIAYKLALALDRSGDTAAERTTLEQVLKIDPGMAPAQNQLGYLISRNGDAVSAEEHFRLAVQASPTYTEAWINLAAALGMESRYPEAQQALTTALRLDPDNSQAKGLKDDIAAAQSKPQSKP